MINLAPRPPSTHPERFFSALDLGQRADHSAFALLHRLEIPTGEFDYAHRRPVTRLALSLRHLHRWPLGAPYLDVARWTIQALRNLPRQQFQPSLAIDAAGPGAPVYEILRAARTGALLQPVIITSGHQASQARDNTLLVPRSQLLSQLRLAFERGQLRLHGGLPLASALRDELAALGQCDTAFHDDLAIALALALHSALLQTPTLRSQS
jgi:hypothetical protein